MSNIVLTAKPAEDRDGDNRWMDIHTRFVNEGKEKDPDVIFLGDSILETLEFTEVWNLLFAPMHVLNFSIHNDCVEHVLWRIDNGELDNVNPKVVVVHIGTNNVKDTVEVVTNGIEQLINKIRGRLPKAYIVIPTLLPRGHKPNKLREKNAKVNELLMERFAGAHRVQIVNIDKGLIQSDNTISHHDMYDYLNLTNAGAKKVFEPISDLLNQILTENDTEKDLTPSE